MDFLVSFSLLLADHRFDLDNLGGMSLDRISHHGFVGKWACLMQRVDIIIGEADIATEKQYELLGIYRAKRLAASRQANTTQC